VSRRHAEVVLDGRGYVVRDLGSNNGTFVNDQRVDETKLNDGDVVRLGLTYLTFREG
jgi:pSer/pThr/pTyr-binding forkhead associated (FHA) protein